MRALTATMATLMFLSVGCGGDDEKTCDPTKSDSCDDGLVCEPLQSGEHQCFAPVTVEGRVAQLTTGLGISSAEVSALDINGAPASKVVTTESDGTYALRIASTRADASGKPVGRKLTLRAAAQDHDPFPSGIRIALPLDMGSAESVDDGRKWVVKHELTELGLVPLPPEQTGHPSIAGRVDPTGLTRSALVVAEGNGRAQSTVADRDGTFRLFNVPPGAYSVRAYARGVSFTSRDVTVVHGTNNEGVLLTRSDAPTGTLSGDATIVAATGMTSIVLVVDSTFNEALVRGAVPPGLRAPDPGLEPDVSGAFSIDGVPDGRYVVLAAFENDELVRDPDPNIAGTTIQRVTVQNGTANLQPQFKVTGAVSLVAPGPSDVLDAVPAAVPLSWNAYSSAKSYNLRVVDSSGTEVWSKTVVAQSTSPNTYTYDGPALVSGRIYQWKVTALSNAGAPLSTSEDLKGVFRVQ